MHSKYNSSMNELTISVSFHANMKKNLKVTFGINKGLHSFVNEPLRALEPHAKLLSFLLLANISMIVPLEYYSWKFMEMKLCLAVFSNEGAFAS